MHDSDHTSHDLASHDLASHDPTSHDLASLDLRALGFAAFAPAYAALVATLARDGLVPARVVAPLGAQLLVAGAPAERAELSGRLRAQLAPVEQPTAGDWVALAPGARADDLAIIHGIVPRRTALVRRAAGTRGEAQCIAANVDTVFVVTSANRDANPRRLERYLAAIAHSGARAVVVVNKLDVATPDEAAALLARLAPSARGAPLLGVSAATGAGLAELAGHIAPRDTIAFVGMSGVGKSSLVNRLLAIDRQVTAPIDANARGRHATTRRELFALPSGGLVIDTPGMRSFGLADDDGALADELATSFADVTAVATRCRFRDCRHAGEPGCAVAEAIDEGALDPARLAALDKLERELAHAERRRDGAPDREGKQRMRVINRALRAQARRDPKRQR